MNSLAKGQKRMVTKVQWLCWKLHDNWVAYFKIWSRRSLHRFCESIRNPVRCVKFTKAVVRHATIRDQNPSLGMICPGELHQRNPNAPKCENRSQEETECQEPGAREEAWRLAKSVFKLKEQERAAFFSPSENRCLPAPSTLKPEEREFVVDSGESMHMISKKRTWIPLNFQTLTKSCSPTTVLTANGEVLTHEEATVLCRKIGYILDNESPRGYASSLIAGKALRWTWILLWVVKKKNISLKTVFRYNVIRKTSYRSWFLVYQRVLPQACLLQHPRHLQRKLIIQITLQQSCQVEVWIDKNGETRMGLDHHPAIVSRESVERQERGDPYSSETSEELLTKPTKIPKPKINEDHERVRWDPCHSDIPEWLQEFRKNLVDDRIPERRDSHARSSHEPSLEPTPPFPKDRNCEICQRTKITRAPCRRRNGGAVPRAENFGDLITADHKFLSEGCESRNNHRYAVVVQDLATQWIQSYLYKSKASQETQRSLQKVLGAR